MTLWQGKTFQCWRFWQNSSTTTSLVVPMKKQQCWPLWSCRQKRWGSARASWDYVVGWDGRKGQKTWAFSCPIHRSFWGAWTGWSPRFWLAIQPCSFALTWRGQHWWWILCPLCLPLTSWPNAYWLRWTRSPMPKRRKRQPSQEFLKLGRWRRQEKEAKCLKPRRAMRVRRRCQSVSTSWRRMDAVEEKLADGISSLIAMMSSCYSAYSATPGKVMPLDPIGRKTFQATGRSKTNKKIEISRRFLQSNCHDVQLLLRLLRYSRQSDAPRSYRQKDISGNRSE